MIAGILPADVIAVEAFDDSIPAPLFAAEEEKIGRAVANRRHEYATVRRCAREALAVLGHPPSPLLNGERGAPHWPVGVVGSMTHCAGYRAAAVAPVDQIWSIGIDAEPHEPLPDGVLQSIALPEEEKDLKRLREADPHVHWDRLLFSAKESVYKAWFPLTKRWLGFEEASIETDPVTRSFEVRLLATAAPGGRHLSGFSGRFHIDRGLVVTAIAVPA